VLGNYADDLEDRSQNNLFNEVYFNDNFIIATKRIWRRPEASSILVEGTSPRKVDPKFVPETLGANQSWEKYAFIGLTVPVEAFDCDKEAFLGTYGSYERPAAVLRGNCSNSEAFGKDAVGVLQHSLQLQPKETRELDVITGIAITEQDVSGIVARLSDPEEVTRRLDDVRSYWNNYLDRVKVQTPDPSLDLAVNRWTKYQCRITSHWSRMASYYATGSSNITLRESCFDLLGILPMARDLAKNRVVSLLQHQYEDGSCIHYWEPRSNAGTYTGHSDDPIWLVFAVTSYLKESGDDAFLDERVKYYYGRTAVPVYDHLTQAMSYALSALSTRNLSLMGPGDWIDGLDQVGQDGTGESIFTSELLAWALLEMIRLSDFRGDRRRATIYRQRYADIRKALYDLGWDGEWFIRATTDRNRKIGSSNNPSGQIYLDVQSWAVLSGIAGNRGNTCMDSVHEKLDTPYGPALLYPAYPTPDSSIGTITRYVPGTYYNGACLTIPAAWAVMAECSLGRGDNAYRLLKQSMSGQRSDDQDIYKVEPYVNAAYACGPESTRPGEGEFTWATGAAPWMWRTMIDYVLGIHPDYPGLVIDPCIPGDWRGFKVVRPFRDAVYEITVSNPEGVCKGVRKITSDHKNVKPGHTLPDYGDGKVHIVTVEMGHIHK
jgi:cellobiose phosphorylase